MVLIKTDRKIKYFERDLKEEKIILDKNGIVVKIVPSREDSLDRLKRPLFQLFILPKINVYAILKMMNFLNTKVKLTT